MAPDLHLLRTYPGRIREESVEISPVEIGLSVVSLDSIIKGVSVVSFPSFIYLKECFYNFGKTRIFSSKSSLTMDSGDGVQNESNL